MKRRYHNKINTIGGIAGVSALVVMFALAGTASSSPRRASVSLQFVDSTMVNDTVIRLGDIARVESQDAALAARLRALTVGEAAPAGFNRFVNTEDLITFRIQPQFRDLQFTTGHHKRVKVISDYQDRNIAEFEEQIRSYAASRLGWETGDWTFVINNLQTSWKSGRGAVQAEVTGLDNPFAKGNVSLTLIVRQGSRVSRIPVQCRITVKTAVLVASRPIQRGEELTAENTMVQVTDITSFSMNPLRAIPAAGTVTAARSASMGSILHGNMLRAIPLVSRGDQVRIHFIGERVRISVIGVARDNGGSGDRIWVENLQTGKLIRAAVSGRGSVTVHQEGDRS